MSTEWKYILDQMEIETADNVKKAAAISLFHESALFTPDFAIDSLRKSQIQKRQVFE